MKKGIIIGATLTAAFVVTSLVALHRIKKELELSLYMKPEDLEPNTSEETESVES